MPPFRQASFAGGELSPALYGRTDLAKYAVGAATLRNFYPTPQGRLVNRPGTLYVGETKDLNASVRLVPFIYDDTTSFVLEFGNLYVRIWKAGVLMTYDGVHTDLATVFTIAEVPRLKFVQVGDVLTLCHPNHPPQELTRTTDTSWAIAAVSMDVPPPYFVGANGYAVLGPMGVNDSTLAGGVTTAPNPDREWQYAITEICRRPNGVIFETQPTILTNVGTYTYVAPFWDKTVDYSAGNIRVSIDFSGSYYTSKVAAGNTNVFPPSDATRWTGPTTPASPSTTITGLPGANPPQYDSGSFPVRGDNLIPVLSPNWSLANAYLAGAVCTMPGLFGKWYLNATGATIVAGGNPPPINPAWSGPYGPQTLDWRTYGQVFADPGYVRIGNNIYRGRKNSFGLIGTTKFLNNLRTEMFTDYGQAPDLTVSPPQGRNPFKVFDVAGNLLRTENPAVVGIFEQRRFFANAFENLATPRRPSWIWGSRTGDFGNFDLHVPSVPDDALEFQLVSRRREEIRSFLAKENVMLLTSGGVWSFGGSQGAPLTRTDVSLRKASEEGAAWNDPLLIGDTVLYVRSPALGINEVSFDTLRQTYGVNDLTLLARHMFEGFTVVDWAYQRDPHNIIWVVRSDGQLLSLTYLKAHDVWAWARHDTNPGTGLDKFLAVCSVPENGQDVVYVLVQRFIAGSGYHCYLERLATRLHAAPTDGLWNSRDVFLDSAYSGHKNAGTTIIACPWLPFATCYAVIGGVVRGPYVGDAAGNFNIAADYPAGLPVGGAQVILGLQYPSDFIALDLATQAGEVHTKRKNIREVVVDVEVAVSGLYAGEDLATLKQWVPAAGVNPTQGQLRIPITYSYNQGGSIALRQLDPVPVSITGFTREVEFGGP